MILVYVFADLLAVNLLHRESLVAPLKVVAIILFFIIINLAQNGVLVGFEDFKNKSINTVIGYVIQSAAMIVGAYYWGIIGATVGYGIGFVSIMILNKHSIDLNFRKIGVKHNLSLVKIADFKILFTYSLPAAISSILAAPTYWIIRTILVRHTSFSELAVYDVADQWRMFVLFIPSTLCTIALPIMSSISNDNVRQFKKILNSNVLINMGIAMLAAVVLSLFSSIILSFYGKGYTDNMPFIIMAISSIFTSVSTMLGVSISSKAKMWTWCGFNILWGAIAIGSSYYFISVMRLGATGAAFGILISFIIHAIVQYLYIQNILKSIKCNPSNI
jgi:O-antigen/teichoic acid export membrane protein